MTSNAVCAAPDCAASFTDHNWGKKQADREGWFMQKDGTSWCPDHVPEWVEAWRNRNAVAPTNNPVEQKPPVPDQSDLTIYTCGNCDERKVASSPFEADKPVGFWLGLLKITGEKYPHHYKTPGHVFFCTKECMIQGLQFGISGMVTETIPIGLSREQVSRSNRR